MVAVILFLYALLSHLGEQRVEARVSMIGRSGAADLRRRRSSLR